MSRATVDARGIIFTQNPNWDRSEAGAQSARHLGPACLVFRLSRQPCAIIIQQLQQANLVRKSILCWRSLLYQLEQRNTTLSRVTTCTDQHFREQRKQFFG